MRRMLLVAAWCLLIGSATVSAQVLEAERLTTTEFAALDRAKTAVVVPGGILEEHGPHLPSASDTYQARWLADALGRHIALRPGWTALMLPMIPLGQSGANDIARQFVYPATITIRGATLRAVYMDLADALGEHGFKFVFLVHIHGAPTHNQMLDQASEYFRETWGGTMVHLSGLKMVSEQSEAPMALAAEADRNADGFTVHAGLSEASRVLFARPESVRASLFAASPLTGKDFADLVRLGKTDAWSGYWGAPAGSSAWLGAALMGQSARLMGEVADAVIEGRPWPAEPFFTERTMGAEDIAISRAIEARERTLVARQRAWLQKKGLE